MKAGDILLKPGVNGSFYIYENKSFIYYHQQMRAFRKQVSQKINKSVLLRIKLCHEKGYVHVLNPNFNFFVENYRKNTVGN